MAALTVVSTFSAAHAARLIAGSGTVGSAAIGGLDAAGTVGGIVAAAVTVGGLWLTISTNNRAKRREYREEIEAAERRGEKTADSRIRELVDELKEARNERDRYWQQWAASRGRELEQPPKGTEP